MADKSAVSTLVDSIDMSSAFKPTDFLRIARARGESDVTELNDMRPWFTLIGDEEEEE
jgi:hypothetical protein